MEFYFTKEESARDILQRYGSFCFDKAIGYEDIPFKEREVLTDEYLNSIDLRIVEPLKTQDQFMPDQREITGDIKGIGGDEMVCCKSCGLRVKKHDLIDNICGFCEKHLYND